MISVYDLYDLSAVYKNIRQFPEYEKNVVILETIINVINNQKICHEFNQIRKFLNKIEDIDKDMYYFINTKNIYTYFPSLLKDEFVYNVLYKSTEKLLVYISQKEYANAQELADCIHNLPIYIAENNNRIPNSFWKLEVLNYRKNRDKNFLKLEEKQLKSCKVIGHLTKK